eukprot:gb/GECH01011903.1/.p1 GENE.gb/GECH01011903.1/~~gb/GECH01011903.1/.p1  ORF type:complete len:362 (+),score=120.24 gb/GECH01011903.1/:1-1086(+)
MYNPQQGRGQPGRGNYPPPYSGGPPQPWGQGPGGRGRGRGGPSPPPPQHGHPQPPPHGYHPPPPRRGSYGGGPPPSHPPPGRGQPPQYGPPQYNRPPPQYGPGRSGPSPPPGRGAPPQHAPLGAGGPRSSSPYSHGSSPSPHSTPSPQPPQPQSSPQLPQERVKLAQNNTEREQFDNMADLYSIIFTVERLEKAYVRDAIPPDEYSKACQRLIAKFKALRPLLSGFINNIQQFMKDFDLNCPAAAHRLLEVGVPATVEHGSNSSNATAAIAEAVAHFITALDNLRLEVYDVDQLAPIMVELVDNIESSSVGQFDGKDKIHDWLKKLNQMSASDKLSEEEARQLSYDLESAHSRFHKALSKK